MTADNRERFWVCGERDGLKCEGFDYGNSPTEVAGADLADRPIVYVTSNGGASKFPAGKRVLLRTISGHRDVGSTECPGNKLYPDLGWIRATVADRMTRHVLTAAPTTSLPEAMAMMVDGHFRHLPIVDSGRVIGMISMRDLMAWASLRLRHGAALDEHDDVDTTELIATIHRMRTGAA